jgi:membrane protein YdbS with pleckstrin-like domain
MKNPNLKTQEPQHLTINRVIVTIVFAILSIISLIIFVLTPLKLWIYALILLLIFGLYSIIYFYLGAAYHHFSYFMNETGLYIHQGVIWRRKIVVPLNRVQHTDVTQGPIARKYKLAELIVHTAGTRNASVKIEGILQTDAEDLRESLTFTESKDDV